MNNSLKILALTVLITLFCSCGQTNSSNKQTTYTTVKNNVSVTFSEDTAKLAQLLDLTTYKPTNVKFKYTFIDNSGQNQRLSVPRPSDYSLEAILYFDSITFTKLQTSYFKADYISPNLTKEAFNFDWLDQKTKDELMKSDTSYHGHPDFFLSTSSTGKLWFLHKKLLLIKSTQ